MVMKQNIEDIQVKVPKKSFLDRFKKSWPIGPAL
jgi:hypothetical protein